MPSQSIVEVRDLQLYFMLDLVFYNSYLFQNELIT